MARKSEFAFKFSCFSTAPTTARDPWCTYQSISFTERLSALILSIKKQANQEILNALINIQNINFKLKDKNFKTAYNYIESINKYPKNHIYWKIQDLSQ